MIRRNKQTGVSLIELMIAIGIIGIIAAIALPVYDDYMATAREGTMLENMKTIQLFQEEARLSTGSYKAGTYDPNNPDAAGGLKELIGWSPGTTLDEITYVVDDVEVDEFTITATHIDGKTVERTYSRPR